ncbi:MFS transporter [Nocardioides panacihumi]|uniref:MFS transporter n=1 Tax=Nocardioides panacihumi TaxID=400774 RepID=A0ABN2RHL1_9ACTN
MYLSLSDRPASAANRARGRTARPRVARLVVTLGVVSLLTDISSESVSAILPLYLTSVVGLSTVAYGFVDGLYQGVSALVRIAGGWVADKSGRPQQVALAGYGLSMLARVALLFAGGVASISTVISADRIGKGLRTAPRDSMITAASDPAHLGRSFGVHRALDTVGAAIGPLLAFLILWGIPDGYHTVLVVSLGFAVLGVVVLGLFVPRDAGGVRRHEPLHWREALTRPMLRLLLVAGFLALLTVGDGFVYLALLNSTDAAAQWFPVLYVGTNIVYLALAVPLGRLADRVGRTRVLVLGHLPLAGAYLAACVATGLPGALAALGLLGTFYACTDGVLAAVAARTVPDELRTSGIACAQTVVALARMGASIGFGVLWFAIGPQQALVLVAGGLALAVGAGAVVLRIGPSRQQDAT